MRYSCFKLSSSSDRATLFATPNESTAVLAVVKTEFAE